MPDLITKIAEGFGKCVEVVAGATASVASKAADGLECLADMLAPADRGEALAAEKLMEEVATDAERIQSDASGVVSSATATATATATVVPKQ